MAIIKLQGELEKSRGIYYEVDPSRPPIGIGGMGRVYQGVCINENTRESKPVAIKFMFEDLPAYAIERARREASIQLKNDNLIEMLGFIETRTMTDAGVVNHYHVVSELLHGVSLSDMLKGKNVDFEGHGLQYVADCQELRMKDPEAFAKEIVNHVLAGLTALHDAGYIHRDIDPSNIMLTSDGHVKLIDFGIAKKVDDIAGFADGGEFTQTGSFVGKPKYAAPEICLGDIKHQNKTTDIYAVGILLFQLITGHLPFDGPTNDIVQMQLKSKMPVSEITNPALRKIVKQATEKQQEKRYQSASEFRVALESETESKSLSNAVIAGLALAGLALGVALAFVI